MNSKVADALQDDNHLYVYFLEDRILEGGGKKPAGGKKKKR